MMETWIFYWRYCRWRATTLQNFTGQEILSCARQDKNLKRKV